MFLPPLGNSLTDHFSSGFDQNCRGNSFEIHSAVGQAASLPAITSSHVSLRLGKKTDRICQTVDHEKRMFYHRRTLADCTVWHESIWIKTSKWMKPFSFMMLYDVVNMYHNKIFTEVITCNRRNQRWQGFQGISCRVPVSCAWKGEKWLVVCRAILFFYCTKVVWVLWATFFYCYMYSAIMISWMKFQTRNRPAL